MQIPDAVRMLERDLRSLFGPRLKSLVVFRAADEEHDPDLPTLAVVDTLVPDDLRGCAARVEAWHELGLATPLLLRSEEFGRSLDAFPFEFGAILADHAVAAGVDPFDGLRVDPGHMRHACEVQARSLLLHLREGFIETRGRGDAVAELLTRSIGPLTALVKSIARLHGGTPANAVTAATQVEEVSGLAAGSLGAIVALAPGLTLSSDDARRVFPPYLEGVERLATYVDRWSPRG